jgi:hypothetical protein
VRTINRNKRPVAYASYLGVQELVDESGNFTGEYSVQYTDPVKTRMNVSGGRGQSNISLFGLTDNFARTVVTDDLETDFNTEMVFWIEKDPDTEPFDYRVVLVSRTINQVVIALAEVEKSDDEVVSA